MSNLQAGVVAASLLCTACKKDTAPGPISDVPLSDIQMSSMTSAIRHQYQIIMDMRTPGESVVLRLNDQSACLTLTVQNGKMVMAQLVPRNPYANDPERGPISYTDIEADGKLETYPHQGTIHPHKSITYGNYLALLTRFGSSQEVIPDTKGVKKQSNRPKNSLVQDVIPPSPELFSRIAQ